MDELFDFRGKVVLITGATRGLGYHMVKAFAARGAEIVVSSRKQSACDEVAGEVRAMGRRALPFACHVGRWDQIEALVDAAYDEFGRVDVLINNAGMSPVTQSSLDVTEELFDKVIGVNLKGPFRLCSLVGHRMFAGEGGCIINISSIGAMRPIANAIPYCGAKAALNSFAESFGKEFKPKVRVNTIAAGPFLTDISESWSEESKRSAPSVSGRPGNPEEIVTAALFLASPASTFVTSSVVRVDGGIF